MKKFIGAAFAIVAVLATSFTVYGQMIPGGPWSPGPGMMRGHMPGSIISELNLTDAQKNKIADICKAYEAKIQPLREQIMEKRQQLMKAVFANQPNKTHIAILNKELNALRDKAAAISTENLVTISQALTPDQGAKLLNFLQNVRHPGMGMMGMRGPGMAGPGMPPGPGMRGPGMPGPSTPGAARGPVPGGDPIFEGLMDMSNM